MFWKQDYTLPNGIVVSYWKLVSTYVESSNKTGICKAKGYLNQGAYEAGKEHVLERDYVIDFSVLDPKGQLLGAVIGLAQGAQLAQIELENPPTIEPEEPAQPENPEV